MDLNSGTYNLMLKWAKEGYFTGNLFQTTPCQLRD